MPLGSDASFAVLAGSTVTSTGNTIINGNLGVSPGTAVTGFPPGMVVNGSIHPGDATAAQAQIDLTTAYNNAAGRPINVDLTGQNLGGRVLVPGVYGSNSGLILTGQLVLNGLNDPNSVFIFRMASTLTTSANSNVLLINGAQSCNVFWQVGSSATLSTNSLFNGTIFAAASITLNTGAFVNGRALAINGAVTLDSDSVTLTGP